MRWFGESFWLNPWLWAVNGMDAFSVAEMDSTGLVPDMLHPPGAGG